ncbi:MAG: hypothetical protein KDB62_06020 [Solirubrobacterales bacterium]|nr:hypothetical protein [Solirubrobacterales bacterium]
MAVVDRVKVIGVLIAAALLLPATASAGTFVEEEGLFLNADQWELGPVQQDPQGNYFVPTGNDGQYWGARERFQVRTPGASGTYSSGIVPNNGASIDSVDFDFDSTGKSWWIVATDTKGVHIVERGAGGFGSFGSLVELDDKADTAVVGVSPGGDVLAAWADTAADEVYAALKPAAEADFSPVQTVGTAIDAELVGAVLDDDGSGVIVSKASGRIQESIQTEPMPGGEPDFSAPEQISAFIPFRLAWNETNTGHAAVGFDEIGGSRMFGAVRAPGVGFSPVQTLSPDSAGDPKVNLAPDGTAAVSFREADSCPGDGDNDRAMAAFAEPGSTFSVAGSLASSSADRIRDPAVAPAGSSAWIAGWDQSGRLGATCPDGDNVEKVGLAGSDGGSAEIVQDRTTERSTQASAGPGPTGFEGLVFWIDEESGDKLQAAFYSGEVDDSNPNPGPPAPPSPPGPGDPEPPAPTDDSVEADISIPSVNLVTSDKPMTATITVNAGEQIELSGSIRIEVAATEDEDPKVKQGFQVGNLTLGTTTVQPSNQAQVFVLTSGGFDNKTIEKRVKRETPLRGVASFRMKDAAGNVEEVSNQSVVVRASLNGTTTERKGNPGPGDNVTVTVTANKSGNVAATGTQVASGGGKGSASIAKTRLKVKLKPVRKQVEAGDRVKLKLKPKGKKGRNAAKKLKKAAKRRGLKAKAMIKVTLKADDGTKSSEKLKLKLKP